MKNDVLTLYASWVRWVFWKFHWWDIFCFLLPASCVSTMIHLQHCSSRSFGDRDPAFWGAVDCELWTWIGSLESSVSLFLLPKVWQKKNIMKQLQLTLGLLGVENHRFSGCVQSSDWSLFKELVRFWDVKKSVTSKQMRSCLQNYRIDVWMTFLMTHTHRDVSKNWNNQYKVGMNRWCIGFVVSRFNAPFIQMMHTVVHQLSTFLLFFTNLFVG